MRRDTAVVPQVRQGWLEMRWLSVSNQLRRSSHKQLPKPSHHNFNETPQHYHLFYSLPNSREPERPSNPTLLLRAGLLRHLRVLVLGILVPNRLARQPPGTRRPPGPGSVELTSFGLCHGRFS